ncbi:MAG: hypothetical protein J6K50_05450, partial [Clostridia bacterium]|nr:hypothetical protein [Clostridia bacterium]
PELAKPSETAKKYIKYGASPRAAQALITCAKVRALINGNYNVSYADIDALACSILRHRIKINYNAVNDKLTVDDVIKLLLKETGGPRFGRAKIEPNEEWLQSGETAASETSEVTPSGKAEEKAAKKAEKEAKKRSKKTSANETQEG